MMRACLKYNQDIECTRLFAVVAVFSLDAVGRLNSHKGKDASIELQFPGWKVDEEDADEETPEVVIPFPGDMEREKFIDMLWATRKNDGGEDDEEEGPGAGMGADEEEDEDEEDGARSEKSEEEAANFPYY